MTMFALSFPYVLDTHGGAKKTWTGEPGRKRSDCGKPAGKGTVAITSLAEGSTSGRVEDT
jgi:hypothetical protein